MKFQILGEGSLVQKEDDFSTNKMSRETAKHCNSSNFKLNYNWGGALCT